MSELRDEIIEAQKTRSDLLKWKLIIASALGAAGLGFVENSPEKGAVLVLALIPLACAYVDLLSRHLNMRMLVISCHLRIAADPQEGRYEEFAEAARSMGKNGKLDAFGLEDLALEWSTLALSALVIAFGLYLCSLPGAKGRLAEFQVVALTLSGIAGLVLALVVRNRFDRRVGALHELAESMRAAAGAARPAAGPGSAQGAARQ